MREASGALLRLRFWQSWRRQVLRDHAERAGLRNAFAALEAALGPEGRATLASA
jgi:hypothetical protein